LRRYASPDAIGHDCGRARRKAGKKQRATLAINATRGTPLQSLAQARPGTSPARNSAD
jgi:hypothetical protein